jgi:hypothetical protein
VKQIPLHNKDLKLQTSLCVQNYYTAICTAHALVLSSRFKPPAITKLVAGFKVDGNGNYSVNNATLGVLVTDEAMQHHEMHKQYIFTYVTLLTCILFSSDWYI